MDIKPYQQNLKTWFSKYRYVALLIIIGMIFLLIPSTSDKQAATPIAPTQPLPEFSVHEELEALLSQVKGAGKVEVMLSISEGERTVYQANTFSSTNENSTEIRHEFITVSDAQRAQDGLVQQVNPPTYLGAIIVCEGADSPAVRLALTEAIAKVTGLGADRISVLKMK